MAVGLEPWLYISRGYYAFIILIATFKSLSGRLQNHHVPFRWRCRWRSCAHIRESVVAVGAGTTKMEIESEVFLVARRNLDIAYFGRRAASFTATVKIGIQYNGVGIWA